MGVETHKPNPERLVEVLQEISNRMPMSSELTVRDFFAGAMIVAFGFSKPNATRLDIARECFSMADAMMIARKERKAE